MIPCRFHEELARRHDQALLLFRDETPEQAAAHRAAVDSAWEAMREHRGSCRQCAGLQQRLDKPGRGAEAWRQGAVRSGAEAAMERQLWRGYD